MSARAIPGKAVLGASLLLFVTLSGCFGFTSGGNDFEPGEDYKPTGKTVKLRSTVLDLLDKPVYPGLNVNAWAFCFKAMDPNDQYSVDAVEYFPDQVVDVANPEWQGTCSMPGPTIRVNQGDKVIVQFENNHVHHHTIHWHGQYVPNHSDGVPGSTQDSVAPGDTFTYEFEAKRAGTLWYHCHVDTQLHVMQGLFGVFIVEPQDKSQEPKDIDREQVLVLSTLRRELMENTPARQENPHVDHQHLGSCGETGPPGCQNPSLDITADTFMINGVSFPYTLSQMGGLVEIEPGERLRLRVLNAGTTFETLHPHGHDFEVTHTDGNPVPESARVFKDTVPIGPGERLDLVIEGREDNEGIWVFHTHVVNHVTNDGQYPGGSLTKIIYPGYEDDLAPFKAELPGGLAYIPPLEFPDDVNMVTKRGLGTSLEVDESWEIPLELPCAVKSARFSVAVDSPGTAQQLLNDLQLVLRDANGDAFETLDVADTRYAEWTYTYAAGTAPPFKAGPYTAHLTGQAVDAVAEMNWVLDYIDDATEHNEAGSPCGADGHGHAH